MFRAGYTHRTRCGRSATPDSRDMTVFIVFLVFVFVAEAQRASSGRQLRFLSLFLLTLVVSMSFYSLRFIT